jgi:hypothetical protein
MLAAEDDAMNKNLIPRPLDQAAIELPTHS